MMVAKLVLLKLILALLASVGIWFSNPAHPLICAPGRNPAHTAPTDCERLTVPWTPPSPSSP